MFKVIIDGGTKDIINLMITAITANHLPNFFLCEPPPKIDTIDAKRSVPSRLKKKNPSLEHPPWFDYKYGVWNKTTSNS